MNLPHLIANCLGAHVPEQRIQSFCTERFSMKGPLPDNSAPHVRGNALFSAVHEINNPLDSLLNLLYLIGSDTGLSDASRRNLCIVQEEVGRISRIAEDAMKQFHRVESAVEADLVEILTSVLYLYQPHLRAKNITVHSHPCPDARLVVYPESMKQVFSNLLLNAIDALSKGGKLHARICKAREWSDSGRLGIRVSIADNGQGIPPENLQKIRQAFFTTKGSAGNGMGLAVVQEIVVRHSGVLKIRSSISPGRSGSVFCIFIPSHIGRA